MFPHINLFHFEIPTFFLTMSLISVFILVLIRLRSDRWFKTFYWLPSHFQNIVWSLAFLILVGGFMGGRLGHILVEDPRYYYESPVRIFLFWQGGFVFLGGFLFAGLLSIIFLYGKRIAQPLLYFDFFAPLISIGYILGRFGCFLNGCCYGKACDLPWGILMPDSQGLVYLRHPTQIYSVLAEFLVLMILWIWQKRKSFYMNQVASERNPRLGTLFAAWLFLHSGGRFVIEFYRDDFRGPTYLLSPSAWLSLILIFASTVFIWRRRLPIR